MNRAARRRASSSSFRAPRYVSRIYAGPRGIPRGIANDTRRQSGKLRAMDVSWLRDCLFLLLRVSRASGDTFCTRESTERTKDTQPSKESSRYRRIERTCLRYRASTGCFAKNVILDNNRRTRRYIIEREKCRTTKDDCSPRSESGSLSLSRRPR